MRYILILSIITSLITLSSCSKDKSLEEFIRDGASYENVAPSVVDNPNVVDEFQIDSVKFDN